MKKIKVSYQTEPVYIGFCKELKCSVPYANTKEDLKNEMIRIITHQIQFRTKAHCEGYDVGISAKRLNELSTNLKGIERIIEFKEKDLGIVSCP